MSGCDSDAEREARFDEICADYLDAADAGETLDPQNIIAAHPDLAESLLKFFRDHQRMADAMNVGSDNLAKDSQDGGPKAAQDVDLTLDISPETSSQSFSRNEVGPSITDYELIEKIAHGGMGVVYKARQHSLNRIVALKMIRSGELADDEEIRRFRVEAEAAAQLQHPGIVPIYQIGESDGQHFFSMAYIEGESLAAKIRDTPLLPKVAATYVMKVAHATHYAHEQGIVHRDLKPANVLLDRNDEPLVTDFGLAKQIKVDNELTRSGQILGTASYMSPEQARGDQQNIGPRSDVYSLGALLYALLTQQPPFTGENPLDILMDVLSKDPDAPSSSNLRVSKDLETICLKCLEKTPAKRYASAGALAEDLQRFVNGEPILARPVTRLERSLRWCRRKPAYATAILLAILLAVGLPTARHLGITMNTIYERTNTTPVSLIDSARAHYLQGVGAALLKTEPTKPQDQLYRAATLAMLHYDEDSSNEDEENPNEPGREHFERAMTLIASQLGEKNAAGLHFALADCLLQLSKYKSFTLDQRHAHVQRARELLKSLCTSHPDDFMLLGRAAFAETSLMLYGEIPDFSPLLQNSGDTERTLADIKLDKSMGVIRFQFGRDPIEKVADDARIESAHQQLVGRDADAATDAYLSLLYQDGGLQSLSSSDLQKYFCDMALLCEGSTTGIKLPNNRWPRELKAIYNAVLGIRLATTDFANRDFQLRP